MLFEEWGDVGNVGKVSKKWWNNQRGRIRALVTMDEEAQTRSLRGASKHTRKRPPPLADDLPCPPLDFTPTGSKAGADFSN